MCKYASQLSITVQIFPMPGNPLILSPSAAFPRLNDGIHHLHQQHGPDGHDDEAEDEGPHQCLEQRRSHIWPRKSQGWSNSSCELNQATGNQ